MKLKKIISNNFQSYQNLEICFDELKVVSITGKYKNSNERSNGSGKSTILDIILYCLFGKPRTKREEDLIRENTEEMDSKLICEFSKSETMIIHRGRKKDKGFLNLFINKEDKTLGKIETQKLIEEKIGMDFDLFVATVFFQQEGADKFTGDTSTNRIGYLKKLLNLGIYDRAYQKTSEKIKITDKTISEIKGKIDYLKDLVENVDIEKITKQKEKYIEKHDEVKGKIQKNIKQKEKIQKEIQERKNIKLQIESIKESMEENNEDLKNNKSSLESYKISLKESESAKITLEEQLKSYENINEDVLENVKKLGEENKKQIGKLESTIENFENEIEIQKEKKENLSEETICSRCNQKLSFEHKKQFVEEIDKKISEFIIKIDSTKQQIKNINENLDKNRIEYKEIKTSIDSKNNIINSIKIQDQQIKNVKESIRKEKEELLKLTEKIKTNNEKLKELKIKYQELKNNFDKEKNEKLLKELETLETEKDSLLSKIKEKENIEKNYFENEEKYKENKKEYKKLKWEYNCLNILKNTFGKSGIPFRIIKESIQEIEKESNKILKEINDGEYRIIFETEKETKKGTATNSLDIYVENNRAIRVYESYSGGQRGIINFAIRMALSKILSKLNNVAYGFIALDEVFGSLDNYNKNKMIDVINYLKPMFYQILVISHSDLKECFADNIIVEFDKNTGISKIKGVC